LNKGLASSRKVLSRGVVSLPIMLDGAPRRRWRSFLRCVPLGTRPAHQPRNCFDPLRRDHTVQSERMELAPGLIIADRRDATGPGGRPREMRRQDGRGIAHSLVNLGLGQVACLKQACAREISARELVPAKSARSRSASLRSAPARLTRSSRASLKSASHRSAALRPAPVSVAKHNEACLSRVEERLMGPPLIGPICRWPTLKVRPLRFGTTSGFSERHAFQALGPRRKNFDMAGVLRQGFHVTRERKTNRDVTIGAR